MACHGSDESPDAWDGCSPARPRRSHRIPRCFWRRCRSVTGKVEIGKPINISNSPGYDNQPSFTPDGAAVLFTSVRGERKPDPANSAATGSDIYRYDIAPARLSQVTNTPEAEYSPTVTPDGRHISVIRVEGDGTQRLWRFTIEGTQPELVLRDVKPVGYHAWADAQYSSRCSSSANRGSRPRCRWRMREPVRRRLRRPASAGRFSASRAAGSATWRGAPPSEGQAPVLTISELDPGTRQTRALVRVPAGATEADTAWTPDGLLLASVGGNSSAGVAARPR